MSLAPVCARSQQRCRRQYVKAPVFHRRQLTVFAAVCDTRQSMEYMYMLVRTLRIPYAYHAYYHAYDSQYHHALLSTEKGSLPMHGPAVTALQPTAAAAATSHSAEPMHQLVLQTSSEKSNQMSPLPMACLNGCLRPVQTRQPALKTPPNSSVSSGRLLRPALHPSYPYHPDYHTRRRPFS